MKLVSTFSIGVDAEKVNGLFSEKSFPFFMLKVSFASSFKRTLNSLS